MEDPLSRFVVVRHVTELMPLQGRGAPPAPAPVQRADPVAVYTDRAAARRHADDALEHARRRGTGSPSPYDCGRPMPLGQVAAVTYSVETVGARVLSPLALARGGSA